MLPNDPLLLLGNVALSSTALRIEIAEGCLVPRDAAEVILASMFIVAASARHNSSLCRALGSGDPGYGIMLSLMAEVQSSIEAVTVQQLELAPETFKTSARCCDYHFQEVAFVGYGDWATNGY